MLGKLGDLLNKDMGTLVKDAGKVLNTDVGAIAKGAGKVLNTDMGDLAKGAGKVLNADLGDLMRSADPAANDKANDKATEEKAVAEAKTPPQTKPRPIAEAKPKASAPAPAAAFDAEATQKLNPAARAATAEASAPTAFDADSTQKLNPADEATVTIAAGGGQPASTSSLPLLPDELVTRGIRAMPTGTSLLVLLPHTAGEFARPQATPVGELTSDPVSAMYSVSGHPIAVKLMQCWDEDEARDRLKEIKVQSGNNYRLGNDGSWILGDTLQGLTFAWTRGNYSFTAIAPKGEVSLTRFLTAFPY